MRAVKSIVLPLLVAVAAPAAAQVTVSLPSGIAVQMTARVEPGSQQVWSGVRVGNAGRIHRIVLDRSQKRYFAYDVIIESAEGAQNVQVRFEPFSLSAAEVAEMQAVDSTWTAIPLLKYPFVPRARAGDTIAIDVLENRATGQKVVDYLTLNRSNAGVTVNVPPVPLRDLSADDVELQLENLRISVNGSVVDASTRFGGSISGPAVWFYTPERGRFVLSLRPNSKLGFRRAGEVSERSLSFTEGQDRFDIQTTSRIAPAGGRFNLYVLHDPTWQPSSNDSNVPLLVGAADRAEWLAVK